MRILLDTNVLLRLADPSHPMHRDGNDALNKLGNHGQELLVVPQVLYEFWVVATRPIAVNGLSKPAAEAESDLSSFKRLFAFLPDTPTIFPQTERLVTSRAILGKGAHEARIVAAVIVHGVTHFLTFNDADFASCAMVTAVTPAASSRGPSRDPALKTDIISVCHPCSSADGFGPLPPSSVRPPTPGLHDDDVLRPQHSR